MSGYCPNCGNTQCVCNSVEEQVRYEQKLKRKRKMKKLTLTEIRAWKPCYDPNKYLPGEWQGTALDILNLKECPFPDRLWVIMRTDLVSEKLMRLFAVWCARQVQHLMKDERSLKALDVAEAFANGKATKEELDAAGDAARDAAGDAARAAAWDLSLIHI
jgi:hypothetical protein